MESFLSRPGAPSSRRDFFKRAGLGAGVLASATALQACDSGEDDPDGADVTLDFSNDFGVLNYAYALEQLEAAFYARVIASPYSGMTAAETAALQDIAKHEAVHAAFLRVAISAAGGTPIPNLTPNFTEITFTDRTSVLTTAQVFEDLGVAAYNGAGQYITSDTYLLVAGKIVSVEARHASVISGLLAANSISGAGVISSQGLDRALSPSAVLAAAGDYIQETIAVSNIPTSN